MQWPQFWAAYKSQTERQRKVMLTALYSGNEQRSAFDDWLKNLEGRVVIEILTNAPEEVVRYYERLFRELGETEKATGLRQIFLGEKVKPKPRRRSKTLVAASWLEELENER